MIEYDAAIFFYPLPAIMTIEQYANAQHHLPYFPSLLSQYAQADSIRTVFQAESLLSIKEVRGSAPRNNQGNNSAGRLIRWKSLSSRNMPNVLDTCINHSKPMSSKHQSKSPSTVRLISPWTQAKFRSLTCSSSFKILLVIRSSCEVCYDPPHKALNCLLIA